MFTGIIEQIGEVEDFIDLDNTRKIVIKSKFNDIMPGESISVNGVCLTAKTKYLSFDVSQETLKMTNLANLFIGQIVNLERALGVNSRFGGHYVTGHIDTIAIIKDIKKLQDYVELSIEFKTDDFKKYTPNKGSIAINGVSLTINAICDRILTVTLIPHTLEHTTFKNIKLCELVNIEYDYYVKAVVNYSNFNN